MKFESKYGLPIFYFENRNEQDFLKNYLDIDYFVDGIADFIYNLPNFSIKNQLYLNKKAVISYGVNNKKDIWKIFKANNWFLDFKNKKIIENKETNNLIISNNNVVGLFLGDNKNNFVNGYFNVVNNVTRIYNIGSL